MDALPDILDLLGKTPREFGALHVHFESVQTVDAGRVVAKVLFQAAFAPMPPGGQIAFHAAYQGTAHGEQLSCFEVPVQSDGGAIRVSYPLRVPQDATHVVAFLQVPDAPRGAQRIRPAWKLHDTMEIPKLSEMEAVRVQNGGLDLTRTLVGTALLGGAGFFIAFNTGSTTLAANTKTTVHKARELPAGLAQVISPDIARPLEAPVVESLWAPGQPLPAAPALIFNKPQAEVAGRTRRCFPCGFEGPAAEYERARTCPSCGEPWA